jgi:hypothetical protein
VPEDTRVKLKISADLFVKPIAIKSSPFQQQELLTVIYLNIRLNTRVVT